MQPRNDPDQAVQREFEMLAARNTVEGYELFIARHPGHPLVREAQRRLEALRGRRDPDSPRRTERPGTGGVMPVPQSSERAIRNEFDSVAAKGTIEAYQLFIARHPNHALAREADRRIAALEERQRPDSRGREGRPGTGGVMPMPRNSELAVRQEYEALSARGTVEAYELFIARHPDHRLAREARRKVESMRGSTRRRSD